MQSGLADSSKERSHNEDEDESVQHASYVKECYAHPPPHPPTPPGLQVFLVLSAPLFVSLVRIRRILCKDA